MITWRFWNADIRLCQDHALQTWVAVQEMNAAGHARPPAPAPRPRYTNDTGHVYYLRIGDRVKIGYTANLFARMASYPPNAEILLLRYGTRELERSEHARFGEHRTDGREWFHANERVLQMISEITEGVDTDWEPEWFQRRAHKPQKLTYGRRGGKCVDH